MGMRTHLCKGLVCLAKPLPCIYEVSKSGATKYDVWNAYRGRNDPRQAHWAERIRVVPEPT